jgi:enolase-phosphatase E1
VTIDLRARGVEVVLLDIEGTTTPMRFVYDILFPYAREHLKVFVAEHLAGGDLHPVDERLANEWPVDVARGDHPQPSSWDAGTDQARCASIVSYAEWLMQHDRKSTGLKMLQGRIWEQGYRGGMLKGEVFPDVPAALTRWRAADLDVAIYSSGSVLAQQLLFSSTTYGDLTQCMRAFFDTTVGGKTESESYRRIAKALGCHPRKLAFISDAPLELAAARSAGARPMLCIRPGNIPVPDDHQFECIQSFDQVVA